MGVGQPGVHRHGRQLDHEADEQQQEGPPAQRLAAQQWQVEGGFFQAADFRQRQEVEGVDRLFHAGIRKLLNQGGGDVATGQLFLIQGSQVAGEVEH